MPYLYLVKADGVSKLMDDAGNFLVIATATGLIFSLRLRLHG